MKVVGVDPGGRDTGVLLRSRGDVELVEIVHLPREFARPTPTYLNNVCDVLAGAVLAGRSGTGRRPLIAVEDLNDPGGFVDGEREPINPAHLIGVSMVLGAILTVFPDAVLVPPGKRGTRLRLSQYPPSIVGGPHNPRWRHPEPMGKGVLRHARSAFDVAGAGLTLARAQRERS